MSESPANLLRTWFQRVWVEGKTDHIDRLCAPDIAIQGLGAGTEQLRGPDGFRAFYNHILTILGDISVTVEETIGTETTAAARWTLTARHTGPGAGIPPTGNTVTITGMSFVHVHNGQVTHSWNEWDRTTLAQALAPPA